MNKEGITAKEAKRIADGKVDVAKQKVLTEIYRGVTKNANDGLYRFTYKYSLFVEAEVRDAVAKELKQRGFIVLNEAVVENARLTGDMVCKVWWK